MAQMVVQGYFNYYAVPGERESLPCSGTDGWGEVANFRRRSQERHLPWTRMLARVDDGYLHRACSIRIL